jgi:hypothetical protein
MIPENGRNGVHSSSIVFGFEAMRENVALSFLRVIRQIPERQNKAGATNFVASETVCKLQINCKYASNKE